MDLIQHPLIHVAAAGIFAWIIGSAMVTGELKLNTLLLHRSRSPVGYWLGMALACFLMFAFGGPVIHQLWR